METSTPINSPQRRKHSLAQKLIPLDETLGDIESEIHSRRQEAINKSTEARRRLSVAPLLAGYTASQLSQHCKDVIKLSTENKINCKNAFNFWLIDVMAAMAKKTDSEINKNFQVASCTLDASVKIYGYRVDAIHTDAVKMAGGFCCKEVVVENNNEKEGDEEKETLARAKTKKKKKKLTVVPAETLNAKSEAEVFLDVVPRQNFLTRKIDGNDLLVKIPKYNDGGLFLLDSNYPSWPYDENIELIPKFENKELLDCTNLKYLLSNIKVSHDDDFCPGYNNFEFGKANQSNSDSEDEMEISQNSGRYEFDVNASIPDALEDEYCGPVDQQKRMNIPFGGYKSDEEISIKPETQFRNMNVAISDMKARISVNPLEYSMFDEKIFKAWAGPAHWKVRPVRKPFEDCLNKEEISKPVASKRTRKGKIKSPLGLFEILEDVLEKNLAENEKTTLFKSTMLNWSPKNTTRPEDLKCKPKNLFCLYHIPSLTICYYNKEEKLRDFSDDELGAKDDTSEELNYCSASILHEDNYSQHSDENPNLGLEAGEDDAWDLGNMVEAPNKIDKIPMSSFRRRKHVDIKHLKRGLWNILTKCENALEEEQKKINEAIEFKELVRVYPSKVSKNVGSVLSAPLIFNALLHLTNEKCLILNPDSTNKFNFVISQ